MEHYQIASIIISVIAFLLCILFFVITNKKSENIFFSMRSTKLMILTNISIFLSILLYSININFNYDGNIFIQYFSTLYFFSQTIIFMLLVLRYHRLYISCKTNTLGRDDLLQFKFFEVKQYYYEYFYVRFMAAFV